MKIEDAQAQYWGIFEKLNRAASPPPSPDDRLDSILHTSLQEMMARESIIATDKYMTLAASVEEPVLIMGSVSGQTLTRLAHQGCRIVALESSPEQLSLLASRLAELPAETQAQVQLLQGEAATFDLTESFSLIINEELAALSSPQKQLEFLARAKRNLASNGYLAVSFVSFSNKEIDAIDGQVHCAEVSFRRGVAMTISGIKFSTDRSQYWWNGCLYRVRDDGLSRQHFARATFSRIDEDEFEHRLNETGFVVAERDEIPFPLLNITAKRCLYTCVPRSSISYPLWQPYSSMNRVEEQVTVLVEGSGCRVRDRTGKEYIDAAAGLWNTHCGLSHPDIIEAIDNQLRRLSYGTLFALRSNEPAIELSKKLLALAAPHLTRVYLTCSGSESVELAIKLSRLYFDLQGLAHKKEVIYLDESYHGTYYGSMGVSGLFAVKERLGPNLPGLTSVTTPNPNRCPRGESYLDFALRCAEELEQRLDECGERVAAFIIEPLLGTAGVVVPPQQYFDAVQRVCRRHKVLLIVDEVATGFGRTGRWFASEHFGLRADMMLLSKGINSGYLPLGAVLFKEEIARTLLRHSMGIGHGSTGNGNPACCAAALATIEVIERENLINRSAVLGEYFQERLQALRVHSCVGDIRGLGLMIAVELVRREGETTTPLPSQDLVSVYESMMNGGIMLYPFESGLTFCPALTITQEEIDTIVARLDESLARLGARDVNSTVLEEAQSLQLSDLD